MARSESGASVVGVIRNDQLQPTSEALLKPADVLLLAGSADAVAAAVELLESAP